MNPLLRRVLLCLLSITCAANAGEAPRPLTVYAAASLKESLDAVAADWKASSGQEVRVSYAATSVLAKQIEEGAPADVFISADAEWMDVLAKKGLVDTATRHDLLGNRLVLAVPAASTQAAFDLHDAKAWLAALHGERLSIAESTSVPAGRYARQALEKLAVWAALEPQLAQSDNVRAALAFVALGEAPLGIVYATDVRAEPKVRLLAEFPADLHAPIVYPVARLRTSAAEHSQSFVDYLGAAKARAVFEHAGFTVLTPRH